MLIAFSECSDMNIITVSKRTYFRTRKPPLCSNLGSYKLSFIFVHCYRALNCAYNYFLKNFRIGIFINFSYCLRNSNVWRRLKGT